MNIEKAHAKLLKSKNFDKKEIERIFNEFLFSYVDPTSVCCTCNGYYGPSFSQHLCATCHAFIYPEDLNSWSVSLYQTKVDSKSDSEDSGNEDLGPAGTEKNRLSGGEGTPVHSANCLTNFPLLSSPAHEKQNQSQRLAEKILALSVYCNEPNGDNSRRTEACNVFDRFPVEVFGRIFSFLDDLSLWSCSRVCKRWERIVESKVSGASWERFVRRRWPLVSPLYSPVCWYKLYSRLIESSNCVICLEDMLKSTASTQRDNSCWRSKRLFSELKFLQTEPPVGVEARALDKEKSAWLASVTGPCGSPYEGGKFYILVQVPENYPMTPPIMRFLTKIFHPNVNRHGDIGLDVLLNNWSLALTMGKLLLSVQSLLTDPNPDICMEPKIGKLYRENKTVFDVMAQLWTWKFAMVDCYTN